MYNDQKNNTIRTNDKIMITVRDEHNILLKFPMILSSNFFSSPIPKIISWSNAKYRKLNMYFMQQF